MTKCSCTPWPRFEQDSYDWDERFRLCCRQARDRRADLVLIGDSITHFWDSAATPVSHGGEVWDRLFSGRNVLNLGFGWDRTPNVLWRLKNGHFVNQKPRAVVLNIGTNNLTKTVHYPGDSPEDAADGILAVIDLLQELSPESRIVSMAVFPRGGRGEELERKVMQMNAIVTERLKGRRNILRLDLTDRFLNPDGSQRKEFFRDGCHLTCAGYEIWGEALRPILDSCAPRLTKENMTQKSASELDSNRK